MNIKQTVKELHWKADQLVKQAERYRAIASELETLEDLDGGPNPTSYNITPVESKKGSQKRHLSAAARRKIGEAQRKRWAALRNNRIRRIA